MNTNKEEWVEEFENKFGDMPLYSIVENGKRREVFGLILDFIREERAKEYERGFQKGKKVVGDFFEVTIGKRPEDEVLDDYRKQLKEKIPVDTNAQYAGVVNFASNGVEDKYDAFQYGFKLGYQCHTEETFKALELK